MKYFLSSVLALFFLGCGTDSQTVEPVSGVHFQGRDCLSCHNVDLGASSHLSFGGTVYRSLISDLDDQFSMCNSRVHLQIVDSGTVVYDSQLENPSDSAGFNGKSNLFGLIRDMPIGTGSYTMRILSDANTTLAESLPNTHAFSIEGFDLKDPSDIDNRYSCNSCHTTTPLNSAPGVLFVQTNIADCVAP